LTEGRDGAAGNVDASGMRWKTVEGLDGRRTCSVDVHDVSPVSLIARHVYVALSDSVRPA